MGLPYPPPPPQTSYVQKPTENPRQVLKYRLRLHDACFGGLLELVVRHPECADKVIEAYRDCLQQLEETAGRGKVDSD